MKRLPLAALCVLALSVGLQATDTVAVVNFINRNAPDEWDWLEKGLADLLITDLARSDKLLVVERERMQSMLQEMKLSRTGLVDEAAAQHVGKALAVDKVLTGSFRVTGGRIEIEAHVVDVATAKLVRVKVVNGKAADVLRLEKKIALSLLDKLEVPPGRKELQAIERLATDDLDAARHHYRALDLLDRGMPAGAFAEALTARQRDPKFLKSRYLAGKLYMALGSFPHALHELEGLIGLHEDECFEVKAALHMLDILRIHVKDASGVLALCDTLLAEYSGRKASLTETLENEAYADRAPVGGYRGTSVLVDTLAHYLRGAMLHEADRHRDAIGEVLPIRHEMGYRVFRASVEAILEKTNAIPRLDQGIVYLSPESDTFSTNYEGPDDARHAAWFSVDLYEKTVAKNKEIPACRVWADYLLAAPEGMEFDLVYVESAVTRGNCDLSVPWLSGMVMQSPYWRRFLVPRGQRLAKIAIILEHTDREHPGHLKLQAKFRPAQPVDQMGRLAFVPSDRLKDAGEDFDVEGARIKRVPPGRHLIVHYENFYRGRREWVTVKPGETIVVPVPPHEQLEKVHDLQRGPGKHVLGSNYEVGRPASSAAGTTDDGRVISVVETQQGTLAPGNALCLTYRRADGVWSPLAALPKPVNYPARSTFPTLVVDGDRVVLYFLSRRAVGTGVYITESTDLADWSAPVRCREFATCVPSVTRFQGRFLAAIVAPRKDILVFESHDLLKWTAVSKITSRDIGGSKPPMHVLLGARGSDELLLFVRLDEPVRAQVRLFRTSDPSDWGRAVVPTYPNVMMLGQDPNMMPRVAFGQYDNYTFPTSIATSPDGKTLLLIQRTAGAPHMGGILLEALDGGRFRKVVPSEIEHFFRPMCVTWSSGGFLLFGQDNMEEAYAVMKLPELDRIPSGSVAMGLMYISASIEKGQTRAAYDALVRAEAASVDPKDKKRIASMKAMLAENTDDLETALKATEDSMSPNGRTATARRARVLYLMGKIDDAIEECRKAKAESRRNRHEAAYLLTNILAVTGNMEQAREELREILEIDRNETDATRMWGILAFYDSKPDDARELLDRKIYLKSNWTDHLIKAMILHESDPAAALALLRKTRKRQTGHHWTGPVLDMLADGTPLEKLQGPMTVSDRQRILCARHFWQGVKARWDGDRAGAQEAFRKAIETKHIAAWPYVAANLELTRLER